MIREGLALWRDPLAFYASMAREQGDVGYVTMGWRRLYLLNSAPLAHQLLGSGEELFGKGYSLTRTKFLLGDGLLTSEEPLHKRQRTLIRPAFHRERVHSYGESITRFARETAATLDEGRPRDLLKDMMRLSQRVVAKSLFDRDLESTESHAASASLDDVIDGFRFLMLPLSGTLLKLPLPASRRLQRAKVSLDRLVTTMIEERLEEGDRGDMLSMLLFARDESGQTMEHRLVRDEAMTIFLAGHDTLGNALAWTWYLLAHNPQAEARWHREIDTVLHGERPTVAALPELPLTRAVLAESMRLYPPVWSVGRQARREVTLGGHTIPKHSVVQICQWLLHRDARYFDDPEDFRPERWLTGLERELPKGAYVPFGLGSRLCIGMQFAWMAGILALASIGQKLRFHSDQPPPVPLFPRITLRPKNGLTLTPQPRSPH